MFTSFLGYNDAFDLDLDLMKAFRAAPNSVVPPTDIYVEGQSLFLKVLLYGDYYKVDDLEVTYNGQILTIKTKEDYKQNQWPNRKYHKSSIFNGAFKVSWQTKQALEFVSAKFKDSVLEIELKSGDNKTQTKNLLSSTN